MLLSCGHEFTPSEFTGEYAIRPDGEMICYACADSEQRADLLTHDRYTAYLTDSADHRQQTLTTWTGGLLARITAAWETSAGGFARGTNIIRFRATDVHGQKWYGTSPGYGMYARMRKAKH